MRSPARVVGLNRVERKFLITIAALALAVAAATAAGCSSKVMMVSAPNMYVDSTKDPYAHVPQEWQSPDVQLIYATDRQPETVKNVYGYSSNRAHELYYGTCTVRLGEEATTWNELVTASTTAKPKMGIPVELISIQEAGHYPRLRPYIDVNGKWVDDPDEIADNETAKAHVHSLLSAQLASTPRKEVYIFVHGYNNTFEFGTYRIAQIWHFIGRTGVPVLYSWPAGSSGLLKGYTRDRESGEFTNAHLKRFLRDVASHPDVEKIHLICHSRGTDILMTAVRELHNEIRASGRDTREVLKIGQWVLAAPDLDIEVFIERAGNDRLGFVADQISVYASPDDKAIGLSTWLFGSFKRLGQVQLKDLPPDMVNAIKFHPVMSIIDVKAKSDATGHGYFLASPACLSDMILVLRDFRRPGPDHGRPLTDDPKGFWQLTDAYRGSQN